MLSPVRNNGNRNFSAEYGDIHRGNIAPNERCCDERRSLENRGRSQSHCVGIRRYEYHICCVGVSNHGLLREIMWKVHLWPPSLWPDRTSLEVPQTVHAVRRT